MKIYVALIDEGTRVWCPVEALHLYEGVDQIVGVNDNPEDTHWAFGTGEKVRCEYQTTADGEKILVAYEQAAS